MKPEDNFTFLTYEIFPHDGDISAYIYKCENYPLCHIDENILEKSEKIKEYQSYYYVYNNDEWGKEINPISKKQNMLIINCKKGLNIPDGRSLCFSYINMKTNKKIINYTDFIKEAPAYRRFIKKDNEDLYFFKGEKFQEIYLDVEAFTGEIKIDIEILNGELKKFDYGNKILYIIPRNLDVNLTIKAITNSVYSIYDNYHPRKGNLKIGSNYLLNIEEHGDDVISIYPEKEKTYLEDEDDDYFYYLGIYSLNCSIYVNDKNNKLEKNEFYQEILSKSDYKYLSVYTLDPENYDNTHNCLFYVSCHKLEDFASNSNGIPLFNYTSQSFKFTKDQYSLVFSFPHTEIENDIKIDFKLLTEGKYKVKIMVDGNIIEDDNINSNKLNIQLKASDLKQKCDNFKFICKILLNLESE